MASTDRLIELDFTELARARRLIRDLANSGVMEPNELRMIWLIADRVDFAVTAKRQAGHHEVPEPLDWLYR